MYKIITVLILSFVITKPLLAQTTDEVWERLFKFQLTIAKQGDSEAMLILGDMYRKGEGTEADPNIALYWYNRAARAGNKKANDRIEELLKHRDSPKPKKASAPKPSPSRASASRKTTSRTSATKTPKKTHQSNPDKKSTELENARKKAEQLSQQLAQQREEAEKARREMQRLKDLEKQLAQERAAAEKARRDMEALKSRQLQLIQERKAAEQARLEAEKARSKLEQTAESTAAVPAPRNNENTPPSAQNVKGEKPDINSFKSNPCDNPQIRDSYSCKLLNRRR